jgi:hypothetical protein
MQATLPHHKSLWPPTAYNNTDPMFALYCLVSSHHNLYTACSTLQQLFVFSDFTNKQLYH